MLKSCSHTTRLMIGFGCGKFSGMAVLVSVHGVSWLTQVYCKVFEVESSVCQSGSTREE